jgi:hypothetical protein
MRNLQGRENSRNGLEKPEPIHARRIFDHLEADPGSMPANLFWASLNPGLCLSRNFGEFKEPLTCAEYFWEFV